MRYTTSDMKRNIKTLLLLSFATAASLCSINLLADDDISMPGMEMPLGIPSLTPVNAASTDSLTATEENTDRPYGLCDASKHSTWLLPIMRM